MSGMNLTLAVAYHSVTRRYPPASLEAMWQAWEALDCSGAKMMAADMAAIIRSWGEPGGGRSDATDAPCPMCGKDWWDCRCAAEVPIACDRAELGDI